MTGFNCTEAAGPLHGTYRCVAHMRTEHWLYGRLDSWIVDGLPPDAYREFYRRRLGLRTKPTTPA